MVVFDFVAHILVGGTLFTLAAAVVSLHSAHMFAVGVASGEQGAVVTANVTSKGSNFISVCLYG